MGSGSRAPEVLFVESHPSPLGALSGLPLIGQEVAPNFAKALLWLKLARHEVYTTSLLKCGTSEPTPAEWGRCRAHFQRELELLRPKVIVALGSLASQILLNRSGPLIGEWSEVAGVPLLCTHHFQDVSHPRAVALKTELAQHLKWLRARLDSLHSEAHASPSR